MKKFCKIILLIFVVIISNLFACKLAYNDSPDVTLEIEISHSVHESFQVFYSENGEFTESKSASFSFDPERGKVLTIAVPVNEQVPYFRFDIGNTPAETWIYSMALTNGTVEIPLDLQNVYDGRNFEPTECELTENGLHIVFDHFDPFFLFEITQKQLEIIREEHLRSSIPTMLLACAIINSVIFVILKKRATVYMLVGSLVDNRKLIWSLSKNDFKTKYAGSALGIIWAFVQPLVTILIYWLVFQFGLRSTSPVEGTPFIIWLTAGMIPWMFFNEALMNATACFIEYSYLVKKVVFKISILPLVKIISSFFVHAVFLGFVMTLSIIYGTIDGIEIIQVLYYMICTVLFVVGLSFATSAFNVFLKDFGQIISIIMQIAMWATPILWPSTIVPQEYQFVLKINPIYYFVEGYRDAFTCNGVWFWDKGFQTFYFWGLTVVMFVIGANVFKRMRNHFADVL